jgi:hypothetical protein
MFPFKVLLAYCKRAVKLSKIIYGDSGVETLRWRERRDRQETGKQASNQSRD